MEWPGKAVTAKRIKFHTLKMPYLVCQKHLNCWVNLMEINESASTFSVHWKWLSVQGYFVKLNHNLTLLGEDEKSKEIKQTNKWVLIN